MVGVHAPSMPILDERPPVPGTAHHTCSTCRFWQPDPDTLANELGECRINPPQHHPLPGDPDEPDTRAGLPRRPWPLTADDDWCGQWRGRTWHQSFRAPMRR
jgi:hypothetical protein